MLQKKICMLGSFGVGKTSLVAQYVHSMFSESYHSTIGVKVDRKEVDIDGTQLHLLLWDIHGDDEFQRVRPDYLRGTSGYLLVADGTRPESIDVARRMHEFALSNAGEVPFLLLINKHDLADEWAVSTEIIAQIEAEGWSTMLTSAKTGEQVNEAFYNLARRILA